MNPRVFVVQPIPSEAIEVMKEVRGDGLSVHGPADYCRRASGQRQAVGLPAWFARNAGPAEVFAANPGLKGVGAMGGPSAFIDFAAARAYGVTIVAAAPEESGGYLVSTTDLTMAMLLGLAHRVVESDKYTREGHFRQEQTLAMLGWGCPDRTVGLIGLGRLGTLLVPRLHAFGMEVIYTKRDRLSDDDEAALGVEFVPDEEPVVRADYVVIACNYNPSTHNLIGARELGLMKPTAFLINTGRAWIVDEPALLHALQNKTIAGAGLDVFWDEPPYVLQPEVAAEWRKLDNVILTPHNGDGTVPSRVRSTKSIAQGLAALIRGEQPAKVVESDINRASFGDPSAYYRGDERVPASAWT